LLRLHESWKSFFAATKEYNLHPDKFKARPKIPRYKHKILGRNVLTYTAQAISKEWLKKGIINFSKTQIFLTTKVDQVNVVRIVPKTYHYSIELVYEPKAVTGSPSGFEWIAGIDIGLNNLATITSNRKGFRPLIINGKPLKSINAYYHKKKALLQSCLKGERQTSIKINHLTHKRNVKVDNYLHNASRFIINHLAANRIGTLVIGKNDNWKQGINLGKRNNQNFVAIPHARFIEMLTYKAQLAGIVVKLIEESYTSKCSFLDNEPCVKHSEYKGKRIKRGLFRAGDGRPINADVNGSANIVKKAFPNAFAEGIQGVVVRKVRVTPYKMVARGKCNICLENL
jgi:putative transposase